MLIKRVSWLKQKGDQTEMTMNRKTRWMFTVAMVAVAFTVAGLRGPRDESTLAMAAADVPKPAAKNSEAAPATLERKPLRTFDYIPADAKLVFVASPSVLLKSVTVQQLQKLVATVSRSKFGVPLREMEDVKCSNHGKFLRKQTAAAVSAIRDSGDETARLEKVDQEKAGASPKQLGDKTFTKSTAISCSFPTIEHW